MNHQCDFIYIGCGISCEEVLVFTTRRAEHNLFIYYLSIMNVSFCSVLKEEFKYIDIFNTC